LNVPNAWVTNRRPKIGNSCTGKSDPRV